MRSIPHRRPGPRGLGGIGGRRRRRVGRALTSSAALLAGACGGGDSGDTEAFCADLKSQRDVIVSPELRTLADVEDHLDVYRDLAGEAPLAIDEHWDALVLAYETASTVTPGDAESEQRALARMYASQPSALAVSDWVRANCGIRIPVATVGAAPPAASAPDATAPPATLSGG